MATARWALQDAKNRLSYLVKHVESTGAQIITVHGQEKAVLLSFEEYSRLTKPATPLSVFFHHSPLAEIDLDLDRSPDTGREIVL